MLTPKGGNVKCSAKMEVMQNAHSKLKGFKTLTSYEGEAKCSLQMERMQNAQPIWRRCKMLNQYGGNTKCSCHLEMQNAHPNWRRHKMLIHPIWRRRKMLNHAWIGGGAKCSPQKEVMHNAPRGAQQHTAGCGCPSCTQGETEIK